MLRRFALEDNQSSAKALEPTIVLLYVGGGYYAMMARAGGGEFG